MPVAYLRQKGVLTLPKEVRLALGLKERDGILITVENNRAVMQPIKQRTSYKEFFGVFAGKNQFPGFDAEEIAAEEAIAESVVNYNRSKNIGEKKP
ncbi:hypothetical protein SY88_14035 [Clostridiales bacterium PH28_bin88]|nr:hypothetical protein SY88_14035 [Clostridiales bacterium PH28_bin88]